jgi:hypothetical protein
LQEGEEAARRAAAGDEAARLREWDEAVQLREGEVAVRRWGRGLRAADGEVGICMLGFVKVGWPTGSIGLR